MLPSACLDGVGTSDDSHCRAQYPAYACPCHRSTPNLAADGVWLRVGMVRYSFPVRLFHPHHSSRSLALSKTRFRLPARLCRAGLGTRWVPPQSFRVLYISSSLPRLNLSHLNRKLRACKNTTSG